MLFEDENLDCYFDDDPVKHQLIGRKISLFPGKDEKLRMLMLEKISKKLLVNRELASFERLYLSGALLAITKGAAANNAFKLKQTKKESASEEKKFEAGKRVGLLVAYGSKVIKAIQSVADETGLGFETVKKLYYKNREMHLAMGENVVEFSKYESEFKEFLDSLR